MECGIKYGQRKQARDVVAWAKKKRRLIRREELLAFLLDKPYPDPSYSERGEEFGDVPTSHQRPLHVQPSGLNCLQGPCYTSPLPSPRRRALFREDPLSDNEMYSMRENGRKRPSSNPPPFEFGLDTPFSKRMRLT